MKIITLLLVITTAYYVQAQRGNILNYIFGGGGLRGGTPCNCKCGVPNMEVRRRSDESAAPQIAKVSDSDTISEEIMMAIAEDAKFTELVQQAEETYAQKCKCEQAKEEAKVEEKPAVVPAPAVPTKEIPVIPAKAVPVPAPALAVGAKGVTVAPAVPVAPAKAVPAPAVGAKGVPVPAVPVKTVPVASVGAKGVPVSVPVVPAKEGAVPAAVVENKKEVVADGSKVPVSVEEFKKSVKDKEKKGRLLAGDTPPPHEFPWLVMIQVVGKQPVAGGALISDRHILTAASPLIGVAPHNVKVSLGVHDRCDNDATSTNISVANIHRHPSFSAQEEAHDLALLELAAVVRFDSRIHPICLPPAATSFQGQVTTLVSWQEPSQGSPPGCLPKRIHLPVLSREECVKGLVSNKGFTPEKSCIGSFGSGAVVCPGDVGTPVQYQMKDKYYLLGIMGSNTCIDNSSTLFTRVADHLNWIGTTVKDDCICRS